MAMGNKKERRFEPYRLNSLSFKTTDHSSENSNQLNQFTDLFLPNLIPVPSQHTIIYSR
jgi:hypothetical protein